MGTVGTVYTGDGVAEGRKRFFDLDNPANEPFDFSEPMRLAPMVPIPKRSDEWLSDNPSVILALEIIAQIFGITINDMWRKTRREYIVVARQAAAYVYRSYGLTWNEISITTQRRIPTLFNACVRAQKRMEKDNEFERRVNLCMNNVRSHLIRFRSRKH